MSCSTGAALAYRYLSSNGRLIDYLKSARLQQQLVNSRLNCSIINHSRPSVSDHNIPPPVQTDLILFLQHPPTFTAGRRIRGAALDSERLNLSKRFPHSTPPLYATERGGELTYHGPGQLVAYPIINLRPLDQEDGALSVRCFVDRLEQIMIDVLSARGVQATRLDGQPGVYVGDGMKIGSIGVHVSRFITSHGLALNCERQTESWFRNIVVCGRQDNRVTSMAAQVSLNGENSNQLVSVDCTLPLMIDSFSRRFQRPLVPLEQIDPHLNRWIDIIL